MASYNEREKAKIIDKICFDIMNGKALRKAIRDRGIHFGTFYKWIEKDPVKMQQYARATSIRTEFMAEELLTIADSSADDVIIDEDGREVTNHHVIQRDRLRVDTRKWLMSKMLPKKYSEKHSIDHTTNGENINKPILSNDPLSE